LAKLTEKDPEAVSLTLLKANALVGQRKFNQADQLLKEARDKAPKNIDLWTFQVNLAVRRAGQGDQGAWDIAAKLLDDAHKQFGDAVWLRLVEASYAVARDPQKSADELKAIGDRPGSWSDDDKLRLYSGLAVLSLRTGDTALALDFARRASAADSKNLAIRRLLFECAWERRDVSGAKDVLQQIKGIEGEGAFWHRGQAALCLLIEPESPALDNEAFQHLIEAGKLRPGWAKVPLLKARILDRQGQIALALESYLESIELGERDPLAVRRAVEILNSRQRYAEADKILRRLEEQPTLVSNELEFERLASEVSARLDNLDRAVSIAGKVAAKSEEWRDHAWLGKVEMFIGLRNRAAQPEQALQHFAAAEESLRKAVRLKPDAPEPWVALIRFYIATDRKPDAETTIKLAERRLPADASALAMAICYEDLDNSDEALKKYQLALSRAPQNPFVIRRAVDFLSRAGKFDEAEARLRPLLSGQSALKPEDALWARRMLASVLRRSSSYPKIQEALGLIEQNLTAKSSGKDGAPEDRQEKALTLATIPSSAQRRQAIQILEDLLPLQADPTAIRVVLSELHQVENNPLQSLKYLRDLATSHERDATHLARYVARLLERRETAEAELWIPRLERLAPNEFSTATVKAEWLVQRNRVDAAIESLRAYRDQVGGEAADRAARLSQAAIALEKIAKGPPGADRSTVAPKLLTEAEAAYREAAQQEPDKGVAFVSFLGRRGRFDEAVALLERVATITKPEAIAGAAGDLVAAGIAKADLQSRLEKVLLDEAQRHGRSISILMSLGDLRTSQERPGDSAELYREVLKQDPNNAAAMNNLAVLLALQKKDLQEAQSLIERAISLKGPFPALLDSRASVYLAIGKPQEALADLDTVVGEEPRPNRQFHRALACWRLGHKQDASTALDAARKLGLKVERLNNLERADYQELVANLKP
jgi:tetratricopeptide (TPR) repeat protein